MKIPGTGRHSEEVKLWSTLKMYSFQWQKILSFLATPRTLKKNSFTEKLKRKLSKNADFSSKKLSRNKLLSITHSSICGKKLGKLRIRETCSYHTPSQETSRLRLKDKKFPHQLTQCQLCYHSEWAQIWLIKIGALMSERVSMALGAYVQL